MTKVFKPVHPNIQGARIRFAQAFKYFGPHSYRMKFAENDNPLYTGGTMGIDKYWRVNYDVNFVESLTIKQAVFCIYHEMFHPLDNFWDRLGDRIPKVFNIAHDLQINSFRQKEINEWRDSEIECPMEIPPDAQLPEKHGFPPCLTAEEYYELLMKEYGNKAEDQKVCGCQDQQDGEGDPKDTDGKITEGEAAIMRRRIAEDLDAVKKMRGTLPGDLDLFVERTLRPVFDPYKELRVAARTAMVKAFGKEDYTFSKRSRRNFGNVVMPGQQAHLPIAAIVVDTSGSMCHPKTLDRCMTEVAGVLAYYKGRCFVHVVSVDAQVQNSQKVFGINAVQFKGGGGTDMTVGFEQVMELKPKPDVCIMITDGYTPWPAEPPKGMKTIVICLTEEEVPAWAKCIRILDDELVEA